MTTCAIPPHHNWSGFLNILMKQTETEDSFLAVMQAIHEWEIENLTEFSCSGGKFIFKNLVNHFCQSSTDSITHLPLKRIYHNSEISEKTIRNKLRELEDAGLIQFVSDSQDKRIKYAVPTHQLVSKLIAYAENINYILKSNFYLIENSEKPIVTRTSRK